MKAGKAYEKFVYEKFKGFYKDFTVTFDDKILGRESQIKRQIDVSIKGKVENIDLLYLVQCKDYTKPANVITIGEFSSVIKDIGASKGFLVCAGGFAKTIHDYAQTLGIELLSVEDINSDKWKAVIEIPIVYIKKGVNFAFSGAIIATPELIERNKVPIQISQNDFAEISLDKGQTAMKMGKYIDNKMKADNIVINDSVNLNLMAPDLLIRFAGLWIPLGRLDVTFTIIKTYYLKYILPDEYSQIKNHVTGQITPLSFAFSGIPASLDSSYVEIKKEELPIFTNLNLEIEEKLGAFADAKIDYFKMFMPGASPQH